MSLKLYGISNCDTVKRARAWLAADGQTVHFHDFKRDGVPLNELKAWLKAFGRDSLVNRKGTTWRKLDAASQLLAATDEGALALMQQQPSVIKRPVVVWPDGRMTLGFDAQEWSARR